MKIKWNEHYTMGIESIDNDHQQLFHIAERLISTVEDTRITNEHVRLFIVREGVKYLKNYFRDHAVREEAYMRDVGYADYAAHKQLHDEFQYVQLARFEEIIDRGVCSKKEALDFIGTGIGWLLEHITTADMAIVGKGVLSLPKAAEINEQVLEREVNMMFTSTLNLDVNARIIDRSYCGQSFGDAMYQQYLFCKGEECVTVLSGIEKGFLLRVAKMVYGGDIPDSDALVLSTLEVFGGNFWRTLGARLLQSNSSETEYREHHYISAKQLQEYFISRQPPVSFLFDSNQGKFFVSSDDASWVNASRAVQKA